MLHWVFCSDNAMAVCEASCCAFQYEEFVTKNWLSFSGNEPALLGMTLK